METLTLITLSTLTLLFCLGTIVSIVEDWLAAALVCFILMWASTILLWTGLPDAKPQEVHVYFHYTTNNEVIIKK